MLSYLKYSIDSIKQIRNIEIRMLAERSSAFLFCILPIFNLENLYNQIQSGNYIMLSFGISYLLLLSTLIIVVSKNTNCKFTFLDFSLLGLYIYISAQYLIKQRLSVLSIQYHEFLLLTMLYVIIRHFHSKTQLQIFTALIIGAIIQCILGYCQLYGLYPSAHKLFKVTGSFFNPAPFSGYLASIFPIVLGIYLNRSQSFSKQHKILSLICIIAIISILPAAQSRAAWVSIIITLVFYFKYIYSFQKLNPVINRLFRKKAIKWLTAILLLTTIVLLYNLRKDSVHGRLFIWRTTLSIIEDNLITGAGYDGFARSFMQHQSSFFINNPDSSLAQYASNAVYAFNDILVFAAEHGLIGIILLLLTLYAAFRTKYGDNNLIIISQMGILSIIIFGLFSYPMHILPIKVNLVIFMAVISSNESTSSMALQLGTLSVKIKIALTSIFLTVLIYNICFTTQKMDALNKWKIAVALYKNKHYDGSIAMFNEAYFQLSNNGIYLTQFGKAYYTSKNYSEAIKILLQAEKYTNNTIIQTTLGNCYQNLGNYNQAEAHYLFAHYMAPGRLYPKYLLANMFSLSGQKEKAAKTAEEVLAMKIKIPSPASNQIRARMYRLLLLKDSH